MCARVCVRVCACARLQAEDANVKKFAERCAEGQANWNALQGELTALDGTLKTVAAVRADMEGMCAQLKSLDEALDAHLQAKEEREMFRWKASIEQSTAQFEAGRQADLVQMEKNLKAEKLRQEKLKRAEEDRLLRETNARKDPSGLHAGDRVELHSLQAKPEYNGNSGILVAFNVVSERWQIDLDVGGSLYVKAANLTKAVACEDPKVDASAMLCARNACFLRNTQAS